jgi:adenylosuccinate lyase
MKNYQSPLATRYGSDAMREIWSDFNKYSLWRTVWFSLAKAQHQVGLPITQEQLDQLYANIHTIDLESAAAFEAKFHHDVMAQLHAYGEVAPLAKGILHMGATSAFVSDNAEILQQQQAMQLILDKLKQTLTALSNQVLHYANTAVVGFTHYQVAQPTTLGKRWAMNLQDFMMDFTQIEAWFDSLSLRGVKGTTGTQASFLELLDHDENRVNQLEKLVAQELSIEHVYPITGQTYPRKRDSLTLFALSGIASSAHKFAVDFRLMMHDKLVSEPFGAHQVGSSAMAYKRNPILSEKISGLARKVMVDALQGPLTAANQWLERSLDDSSNRRLVIAESFIVVDEILESTLKIIEGVNVHQQAISAQLQVNLPFLATEPLLMAIASYGGDRQVWHEHIRRLSMEVIDNHEEPTLIISRLQQLNGFLLTQHEVEQLLDPTQFIGLAPSQAIAYAKHVLSTLKEKQND